MKRQIDYTEMRRTRGPIDFTVGVLDLIQENKPHKFVVCRNGNSLYFIAGYLDAPYDHLLKEQHGRFTAEEKMKYNRMNYRAALFNRSEEDILKNICETLSEQGSPSHSKLSRLVGLAGISGGGLVDYSYETKTLTIGNPALNFYGDITETFGGVPYEVLLRFAPGIKQEYGKHVEVQSVECRQGRFKMPIWANMWEQICDEDYEKQRAERKMRLQEGGLLGKIQAFFV